MKIRLWRLSLLGFALVPGVFGSACVTATLNVYDALGFSCTLTSGFDTVTLNSFTFAIGAMSAGLTPMADTAITVTPSFSGSKEQVLFTATGITPSTGFTVSGSQFVQYDIGFNWDPVAAGAADELDDPPVFPGTATVTTNLCAGQAFGGALCPTTAAFTNQLQVSSNGVTTIPYAITTFAPPNPLKIGTFTVVDLEANGASSTIKGFAEDIFILPEPDTMVLVAAGFIALMWRRLSRRKPAL